MVLLSAVVNRSFSSSLEVSYGSNKERGEKSHNSFKYLYIQQRSTVVTTDPLRYTEQ